MACMHTIYARVDSSEHAYVQGMAAASGLSMSVVISLLIREARQRGWSIQTTPAQVREDVQPSLPTSPGVARGTAAGRPPQPRRGPATTDH